MWSSFYNLMNLGHEGENLNKVSFYVFSNQFVFNRQYWPWTLLLPYTYSLDFTCVLQVVHPYYYK